MGESTSNTVIRRFGKLNTFNLLYTQAELHDIQGKLEQWTEENNAMPEGIEDGLEHKWAFDKDWKTLSGKLTDIPDTPEHKEHEETAQQSHGVFAALTSAFAGCMGSFSTGNMLETSLAIMAFAIFQVVYMEFVMLVAVVQK